MNTTLATLVQRFDAEGKVADVFDDDSKRMEVRREGLDWYRGYDRRALLAVLTRMRDAALKLNSDARKLIDWTRKYKDYDPEN